MPMKQINIAAGTSQVKLGPGKIWSIVGVAAGTTYAFQIKDGPDSAGNTQTIMGQSAAIPVIAGVQYVNSAEPMTFRDGFQMVMTGTPGDIEVQYD